MVEEACPVGKGEAGGALDARGIGRVIKENPARIQVLLDEVEKIARKEIGDVGTVVPCRVRDNGVEAPARIGAQPAAASGGHRRSRA